MSPTGRLVDATIECLATHGYSGTTTRKVAEIAGVSQGALQHYFPTKSSLVEAALAQMTRQLLEEATSRVSDAPTERARAEALLEMIVAIHRLPITPAVLELFVAARTDPVLARTTATMSNAGMATVIGFAQQALPTYAKDPRFGDLIQTAMATARGTALLAAIPGADGAHPSWDTVRQQLIRALDSWE